ncbi:5'-deoxynucleotidase HDDC2 [Linum grandiflorum]
MDLHHPFHRRLIFSPSAIVSRLRNGRGGSIMVLTALNLSLITCTAWLSCLWSSVTFLVSTGKAIVGDITPSDGVPKAEKSRLEQAALDEMCKMLGGGMRAEEIKELWYEYENNASLEANLVKDFDKVEMILQALEYETERGKVLDEFFISTAGKFQTEIGKSWAAEIISRRTSPQADKQ